MQCMLLRTILVCVVLSLAGCAPSSWFSVLDLGPDGFGSNAYGLSDDGRVVCGEVYDPGTLTHGRGTRWDRSGTSTWTPRPIPFLEGKSRNNPALGVSPDGKVLAGGNTFGQLPVDTQAYLAFGNAPPVALQFLVPSPSGEVSAMARSAADNGVRTIGFAARNGRTDHRAPCIAMQWSGGSGTASIIDTLADAPPSTRAFDVTSDGHAIVGEGSSAASLTAYSDPGVAQEAVLWDSSTGTTARTWLGFPPGSIRKHSVAYGISSDSSSAAGYVIVGASGGTGHANTPNAGDNHARDRRPTKWTVSVGVVTAQALPQLWGTTNGSAFAVSRGGQFVVGSCASDDFSLSEAVIWGWNGSAASSVRSILWNAGVTIDPGLTLWAATGISADGRTVCGLAFDQDYNEVGWVARLPPPLPPAPAHDLKTLERKFPNFPVNPLY